MKTFLKIDYWVQTVLLVSMFVTIPFVLVPMLLLIVFGGWQLMSGAITGLFLRQLNRKFYLLKSIGYLGFLFSGELLGERGDLFAFLDSGFGYITFFLGIPFIIGLWYYNMVRKDYLLHCEKEIVKSNTMEANSPMEK